MALIPMPHALLQALRHAIQEHSDRSHKRPGWRFKLCIDNDDVEGFIDNPFDVSSVFMMVRNLFGEAIWGGAEYLYALDKLRAFYSTEQGFEITGLDLGVAFSYRFLEGHSAIVMPKLHRDVTQRAVPLMRLCVPVEADMELVVVIDTTTLARSVVLNAIVRETQESVFLFEVLSMGPEPNMTHQTLNVLFEHNAP